jgi:hypothetical protein
MKGDTKTCPIHGDYVHVGESDECPTCAYNKAVDFPEEYEWEEDDGID